MTIVDAHPSCWGWGRIWFEILLGGELKASVVELGEEGSFARTSPEDSRVVLLPIVGAKDWEERGRCF